MTGWSLYIVLAFALYGSWHAFRYLLEVLGGTSIGFRQQRAAKGNIWCPDCGLPQVRIGTRCCTHGWVWFCPKCKGEWTAPELEGTGKHGKK